MVWGVVGGWWAGGLVCRALRGGAGAQLWVSSSVGLADKHLHFEEPKSINLRDFVDKECCSFIS